MTGTNHHAAKSAKTPHVRPLDLPGLLLVTPVVHQDARGFFTERYAEHDAAPHGIGPLVQVNHSRSHRHVLRGLHWQTTPTPQGKLVWVVRGEILDVAVDLRAGSPHYGRHITVTLSDTNHQQLWIPAGFAHGFLVQSELADVHYGVDAPHDPTAERSVAWNDPGLAIDWGTDTPILSQRDAAAPQLTDLKPSDQLPWSETDANS